MLDDRFNALVSRLIDVQLVERRRQVPFNIQKAKREAAAIGTLGSSRTVLQIQEICARELEIRAILIWQAIVRVHRNLGSVLSDTLGNDLKDFMATHINEYHAELTEILSQNLSMSITIEQVSLDQDRDHAIQKHEVEIDLYLEALTQTAQAAGEQPAAAQQYNFYGAVGAVQSGASASANIVQNLAQGDKDALIQALELAREAIDYAQEIADIQKQEMASIVEEVKSELNSGAPNNTRLRTLFMMIGTSIQTLASAQPAYQALKGALIPLGIMLP